MATDWLASVFSNVVFPVSDMCTSCFVISAAKGVNPEYPPKPFLALTSPQTTTSRGPVSPGVELDGEEVLKARALGIFETAGHEGLGLPDLIGRRSDRYEVAWRRTRDSTSSEQGRQDPTKRAHEEIGMRRASAQRTRGMVLFSGRGRGSAVTYC